MNKINLLMASALLLVATALQAAEVVGKVGYMSGSLMVRRADGAIKVIGTNAEVLAGDTLVTAKDSYAQVQMSDGGRMTLRPHSTLKIEEYQFNKQEPKADTAVFNLIKGGLRSVTGLIGKRGDEDAYKVRTQSATIGIRGTDYTSRLCSTPNCQDDMASAKTAASPKPLPVPGSVSPPTPSPTETPPGLYVTVHNGQVVLAQADKSLNLGRGETGFASAAALAKLSAPPAFLSADTKLTNAIEAKARKAEEKKDAGKPDDGKDNGKSDKEKPDSKSDKDKDDGKSDKEKSDSKSDKDKDDGKSDKEKSDSKSDKDKDDSKADKEKSDGKSDKDKDGVKPDKEKSDSKTDKGDADKKSDEGKNNTKPNAAAGSVDDGGGNTDSPNPAINQGGCVVQ